MGSWTRTWRLVMADHLAVPRPVLAAWRRLLRRVWRCVFPLAVVALLGACGKPRRCKEWADELSCGKYRLRVERVCVEYWPEDAGPLPAEAQ